MKVTCRRISITDNLIFFNKLKPEETKVPTKINRRDIYSIMAIFRLTLWQIYYSAAFVTRGEILTKLNKNIIILKKCVSFKNSKSNIHLINLIFQDFSQISYQRLVCQQRNLTRGFVDSLRIRRNSLFIPSVSTDELPVVNQNGVMTSRDRSKEHTDLIHDAFMNSTNLFSSNGFGSGPRTYAAVAQLNIRSNFDAQQDINLTELILCTAWFE